MNYVIELKNLTKSYNGIIVLNNFNMKVKFGTIHGFLGPNGAGKSTCFNIISTLSFPDKGEIFIDSKKINREERSSDLIFLPAEFILDEDLSVKNFINEICVLKDLNEEKIYKQMEEFELLPHLNKKISELSTGWKKIVHFFSLIICEPKILILDEPFNGLDYNTRSKLINKIKKMKEEKKTILFSSHIISELKEFVDYITIIKKGENSFEGKNEGNIEELYKKTFDIE